MEAHNTTIRLIFSAAAVEKVVLLVFFACMFQARFLRREAVISICVSGSLQPWLHFCKEIKIAGFSGASEPTLSLETYCDYGDKTLLCCAVAQEEGTKMV